jgi:hypothetical protein
MDWNERYREPGYAYGTAPNDFIVSVADSIPPGKQKKTTFRRKAAFFCYHIGEAENQSSRPWPRP